MAEKNKLKLWLEDVARRITKKYTGATNARGMPQVVFQDGAKLVTITALPRLVNAGPAYIEVNIASADFVKGSYNYNYNIEVVGKHTPRKLTSRAAAALIELLIKQADSLSNALQNTKMPRRSKNDLEFPDADE